MKNWNRNYFKIEQKKIDKIKIEYVGDKWKRLEKLKKNWK